MNTLPPGPPPPIHVAPARGPFHPGAAAALGPPPLRPAVAIAAGVAAAGGGLVAPPMMGRMLGDELTFSPHFVKCPFKDVKLRMRIGLVVLLPSGVDSQSMLKSKVLPDGRTYCLDMLVPDAVTNPEKFLLFIRAFMLEHSGGEGNASIRESAFHEAMSTMRVAQNAPVWRRFKLVLDFPVVEDIVFSHASL
jgi:hypothetical protein